MAGIAFGFILGMLVFVAGGALGFLYHDEIVKFIDDMFGKRSS